MYTSLEYEGVMQSWITSDRQLLYKIERETLRPREYKANAKITQDELQKRTEEGRSLLQLQQAWILFQGLPTTKEDEKGTKILGLRGNCQEDILGGDGGI